MLCRRRILSQCQPKAVWGARCTSCAPQTKPKWPSCCGRYIAISKQLEAEQLLSDCRVLQVVELERELTCTKAQGKKVCQQLGLQLQ